MLSAIVLPTNRLRAERCRSRALFQSLAPLALSAAFLSGCGSLSEDEALDCSTPAQNRFVYELMKDYYLWASSTPDIDPAGYDSPWAVLEAMADRSVDRWSGIGAAEARTDMLERGRFVGIGLQMVRDTAGATRVALVHRGSPAEQGGIARGQRIVSVNGVTAEAIEESDTWGTIFGPNELGVTIGLELEQLDGSTRSIELVKDWVAIQTVHTTSLLFAGEESVGYLLFTGFLGTSDEGLRRAFEALNREGAKRLVLDLRYNGGGFVSVATLLASLVVAEEHVGEPFIVGRYNERHAANDFATLFADEPAKLGAERLVALTGPGTASASELVVNGLRPYLEVELVGERTHGKPVGANTWNRCGLAITPITFRTLNADGEGDYFDGLAPGCEAPDDLAHDLGDPREARLAAALARLRGEACPPSASELRTLGRISGRAPHGSTPVLRGPADTTGTF
jgi:C-terminal peptidase prc